MVALQSPPRPIPDSWSECATETRRIVAHAALAGFGGIGGYAVGALAAAIMGTGGPWWAVLVAAIAWGVLAATGVFLHWLKWRIQTPRRARLAGAWTAAIEVSPVLGSIGGIAVSGVVVLLFSAAASNQSKPSVALSIGVAVVCVATVVSLWYVAIGRRLDRGERHSGAESQAGGVPLRRSEELVSAVWIGGQCSLTWATSRQPPTVVSPPLQHGEMSSPKQD